MPLQAIKVADLLHNLGSQDTVQLHDVQLADIELHDEHLVQWYLDLQSMSAERVGATFREIECGVMSICDHCGKSFIRPVRVDEYDCTFTVDAKNAESDDETFPIDDKENIHIDEPLRQSILLTTPVAIHCIDCINDDDIHTNAITPDEIEDNSHSEEGGTVIFR